MYNTSAISADDFTSLRTNSVVIVMIHQRSTQNFALGAAKACSQSLIVNMQ